MTKHWSAQDNRIPVLVLHPSGSFRRGLAAALDTDVFELAEPAEPAAWLAGDTRRVVVVADGTQKAVIASAGENTVVVVLVATLDVAAYRRALADRAAGVAHIDADPATIALVTQAAVTGEVILPTEVARRLAGRLPSEQLQLSQEELNLLQRLSDGATVVELADEFFMGERTIRRRLQNVYLQLGASGRSDALKRAAQLGLIE